MAKLEICKDGHPSLKKSCKSVRTIDDETKQLIADMAETMIEARGVGLAANQVGVSRRIIVVYERDEETGEPVITPYINPRITWRSDDEELSDEGCLSFPLMFGTVARAFEVEVAAQDISMKKFKLRAEGFLARVFQHEIDHLNGITFVERVEKGTLRKVEPDELEVEEELEGEEALED